MKYYSYLALFGLSQANQIVSPADDTDFLLSQLDSELTNLIEAQTFYNAVPSVAEYGGHHYHNWEVLPDDLPQGDHTEYVTPRFMKKAWS